MNALEMHAEAKRLNPSAIVLIRAGDFYEALGDDALTCAAKLGLVRQKRGDQPSTGFPYHQLAAYTAKLVKEGFRVAIVERVAGKAWDNPQFAIR